MYKFVFTLLSYLGSLLYCNTFVLATNYFHFAPKFAKKTWTTWKKLWKEKTEEKEQLFRANFFLLHFYCPNKLYHLLLISFFSRFSLQTFIFTFSNREHYLYRVHSRRKHENFTKKKQKRSLYVLLEITLYQHFYLFYCRNHIVSFQKSVRIKSSKNYSRPAWMVIKACFG